MYHTIDFVTDWWADLGRRRGQRLEHVLLRRGTRRRACIRPHLIDKRRGFPEVIDLRFEDGTTAFDVSSSAFAFADSDSNG